MSSQELSKWIISIEGDIRDLKRNIGQAETTTKSHSRSVKNSLATIKTSWLAVAGAAYAVVRAVQNVGREYGQFEHKMREVNTLIGMGTGNFQSYKKSVLEVTRTVPQSARELSAALYDIVSAGVAVKDSAKVLELSGKAAVAGVTDTKTAARAGISVINAYGMSMDQLGEVYDTLFQTVRRGVTTFPELANNIGQVLPIARSAGVSFEEVAGAIATMTKSGINTAEATTYLRNAIMKLRAPTGAAAEGAKKLGIQWKGLIPTLREIREKGIGIEEMKMLIPDLRAAQGVLALSQNIDTLNESMEDIGDASGSMEDAYGIMEDSPVNQVKMLGNAFNELKIALTEAFAPGILKLIEGLTERIRTLHTVLNPEEILADYRASPKMIFDVDELKESGDEFAEATKEGYDKTWDEATKSYKKIKALANDRRAWMQKKNQEVLAAEWKRFRKLNEILDTYEKRVGRLKGVEGKEPGGESDGGEGDKDKIPTPTPTAEPGTGASERFQKGYKAYEDFMDKTLQATNRRLKYEEKLEKEEQDRQKKAMDEWIIAKERANEVVKEARWELAESMGRAEQVELEKAKEKHEKNMEILVAAHESGIEEEERYEAEKTKIQRKYAEMRTQVELQSIRKTLSAWQQGTSAIGELFTTLYEMGGKKSIDLFNLMKTAAIAEIAVNTAVAVMKAYAQLGPVAGSVMTGILISLGAAQAAKVAMQEPPKMAEGGLLRGRKHSQGGIAVEAEDNEYIEPANVVRHYGTQVFEALRRKAIPKEVFAGLPNFSTHRPALHFAEGGLVSGRERIPGRADEKTVSIANYIDENLFQRYMATREGQDAIVNVIGENSTIVKRILNEV